MNTMQRCPMSAFFFAFVLIGGSVGGQTTTVGRPPVYVDANLGSDVSGTGSQANPWLTITHALAQVTPPVEIHVAPGLYDAALGEVYPLTLDAGISLIGAGMGQTVLQGSMMSTVPGQPGILVGAQQGHASPDGIYALTIEWYGIGIYASNTTGSFEIRTCEIKNCGSQGIGIFGDPVSGGSALIENCFIHDMPEGIFIYASSPVGSTVRGCTVINTAQGASGFMAAFTDNVVRNSSQFGAFVGSSGPDIEVARNIITNSGDFGLSAGGSGTAFARVHDNLIVGAGDHGMQLLNNVSSPPHLVYNNTLVNTGPVGIKFQTPVFFTMQNTTIGARLWNNLISGSPKALEAIPLTPSQCGSPCFSTSGTVTLEGGNLSDLPPLQCGPNPGVAPPCIPQSSGPFQFADPMNEDYTLVAGSPGVDEGVPMGQFQGFFDFAGRIRSVDGDGDGVPLPDVGAFELNPGPTNGVLAIGNGCSVFSTDPSTFPPLTSFGGAPTPGNAAFGFDVFGSFPFLPTFMTVAYDLAPHREPLLNPRCVVWLDLGTALPPLFAAGTLDASGHWLIPAPIPAVPALSGFGLHLQGLIHDPASGITALTNALQVIIP